ncbi:MAG: ABC transporter substrate-binding protein [Acidimicrobiales bacterium]
MERAHVGYRYGPEMDRRRFIKRCLAAGIAVPALPWLLDACASSTKAGTSVSPTSRPLATNQDLTIGATQDLYVTSGPKSALGSYPLNANVYESLIRLEPDYSTSPWLAQRWEQTATNTFRFHLRPGVTFHDGSPFTAADVKYTFDRIASAGGGLVGLGPDSTVVVDPMTVDVTPKKANLRIFEEVVHPQYSIYKAGTQPGPGVPGTGPFRFTSYVTQSRLAVTRNDSYWGTKAGPSTITFQFEADANSRSLALSSGQLDIAIDVPRPSVTSLEHQSGVKIASAPVGLYNAFYINIHGAAPYTIGADPAVRSALQMGIDRPGLIKSVFGGLGAPAQTLLPPALLGPAASAVKGWSYDPAKAKAALDSAGWTAGGGGVRSKGGTPLQLVLVNGFPDAAANSGTPEFVQANLAQIGVGITIKTEADGPSYSAALAQGAGDLFLETGNQNDANPAFLPEILFFDSPDSSYAKLFAPGPAFDQQVSAALAATTDAQAKQAMAEAIHQVVDVSAVLVELAALKRIFGLRSNVEGLVAHPSDVNQSWASLYRVA